MLDHLMPPSPETATYTSDTDAKVAVPSPGKLFARFQPALNAALWQNHVPVLTELSFGNVGEATLVQVTVELASDPPVLLPRTWHLQQVGPGQVRMLTDLDVRVDGPLLAELTEAVRGNVTLTARTGDSILAEFAQELRVLPHNEWAGTSVIPDLLAAFVEPNDPSVARIVHKASDLLRAQGKADSLEGYQTSKTRVWEQAAALWSAVCSLDIRYINPPPSFEQAGQRIRPPRMIVEDRLATCLDLAVLFAAGLENIGLRPLVVLTREHAFAGLWLSKGDFGTSTVDDAPGLRTRLALDDLLVFEATGATSASKPAFRQACAAGRRHLDPDNDAQFETVIDIHRARQRRIRPLAMQSAGYARQANPDIADEVTGPPVIEEAPPLREEITPPDEVQPTSPEGRLARWRKRLLDLSGRNRLLNLREAGRQFLIVDCPDPARLEDMLAQMRGRVRSAPLRFRSWPDLMTGADPRSAVLHRDRLNEEADRSYALEALAKRELLVGRSDEALQAALTEIYRISRAAQQEGGSNTLFLTIGTLLWRQKGKDTPYRAPLILVPVLLERPSVRSGFVLRAHDDETRLNATLLEMLNQDFAIRFPVFETERPPEDDAGLDVPKILDVFRAKLRDIPGWEVRDEVALTNLSFTKYLMWKDLTERAEALRQNEVTRLLMDGAAATGESAGVGSGTDAVGSLDDTLSAANLVCPLEADSSQLAAVAAANSGKSFVLIGPPGTGKSQTIANIIADSIARGRSVLFVAEKRAALEVVQRRLRQVDLDDFCLDLFSSKVSKMAVLEQLDRAQQANDAFDGGQWRTLTNDLAALRDELNGYVHELHHRARNGWTPFRAIGCILRAEDAAIPFVPLSWPDPDEHDAGGWQRLLEMVEEAAATLTRIGGVAELSALAGLEPAEWSPLWQAEVLGQAGLAASSLDALVAAASKAAAALALGSDVKLSRPMLAALAALAETLMDPLAADGAWALNAGAETTRESLLAEAARAERRRELRGSLAAQWNPAVEKLPLPEIRAAWRQATQSWAMPRFFALRALRKQLAGAAAGAVPDDCAGELDMLIELREVERASSGAALAGALGHRWRGWDTSFARLDQGYEWARRLWGAAASCAGDPVALLSLQAHLKRLVTEGADMLAPTGLIGQVSRAYAAAWTDVQDRLVVLTRTCGSDAATIVPPNRDDWAIALSNRLSAWNANAQHVRNWCSWRGVAQTASDLGLSPLIHALEQGTVAPADLVRTLEANYARWWVNHAVHASPRLRSFVAARHETRLERFRALDARLLEISGRLARVRIASGIPIAARRQHDPEYALLARELAKRQRHLPVRQLAARMPSALRRLTPCLMMSPLSVAQYLPADAAPFDLVVFDEASQIPTWDAVGTIGRGRQVIVVGDPKQLPPTTFFERRASEAEGAPVEVETHDLDSILDECLGAGIPTTELTWHYRSRQESLIAFSNATYYGGRLVTFPSPVTHDGAVEFRHVADGCYARAGARTNQPEARALVAAALGVLRADGPTRSIGIVTFNAEQQALIEDMLDKERRSDPSLERFFGDDAAEPVLVKNLEGVQGEERDVMLFSLTYGPDQTGRVSMNFGPLNLSGGERRLNVAVTRARERLLVFSSLQPEQIDLARTNATGVAHLKQFLAFAKHGARAFATTATGPQGTHESPFEMAVAERLRRKGWTVHPQIGASGFRIDLAVVDPDLPGTFLAGVECDGATYHRSATARDRDRLRQLVLEGLGWRILRIWSTDWWTNSGREIERVHGQLETLLAELRLGRRAGVEREGVHAPVADITAEAEAEARPGCPAPETVADDLLAAEAGRPAVPADPALFYEASYQPRLASLVAQIIDAHGPIREDRLIQQAARAHGFQRAGREIRDRVLAVVPGDAIRTRDAAGTFYWPVEAEHVQDIGLKRFRRGASIDPFEVPIETLISLAWTLLPGAADDEALLTAMRDRLGMQKLRTASRDRCLEAITVLRSKLPQEPPHQAT